MVLHPVCSRAILEQAGDKQQLTEAPTPQTRCPGQELLQAGGTR